MTLIFLVNIAGSLIVCNKRGSYQTKILIFYHFTETFLIATDVCCLLVSLTDIYSAAGFVVTNKYIYQFSSKSEYLRFPMVALF